MAGLRSACWELCATCAIAAGRGGTRRQRLSIAGDGCRDQRLRVRQRRTTAEDRRRETYPDEPWRWRQSWETGVVAGSTRTEVGLLLVIGLIFLGLSLPGVWAIPAEIKRGNPAILLVLLFTLVGLGFLAGAVRRFAELVRFGKIEFKLDPFPGSWGGVVGGTLVMPKGAWVTGDVSLSLRCLRRRERESSGQRHRREVVLYETDQKLTAQEMGGLGFKRTLPVRWVVERGHGEPSDGTPGQHGVDWTLTWVVPVRGRRSPLRTEFVIPVFDRGESMTVESGLSAEAKAAREARRQEALSEAGLTRVQAGGEEVWTFHQPTVKKHTVGLILFGAVFAGIAWWVPLIMMQLVFGGFALLLFALVPGILWHRSELRVGHQEIEVRRRSWRGWKSWRIPGAEIASLELAESMRAGATRYLRLTAIGVEGVDPERPHPAEHFKARKARYRWKHDQGKTGQAAEAALQALLETPCFEIELAGYLQGTRPAEEVKHLLERRLGIGDR